MATIEPKRTPLDTIDLSTTIESNPKIKRQIDRNTRRAQRRGETQKVIDQIKQDRDARFDSYKENFGSWWKNDKNNTGADGFSALNADKADTQLMPNNYNPTPLTKNEELKSVLQDKPDELQPKESIGVTNDFENGSLSFDLPDYGYEKYVMDIANWQKQRMTLGGEPGYYYFKIFFNFKTNYGLLGGLMTTLKDSTTPPNVLKSINTAYGYLKRIRKTYGYENIDERMIALAKFTATLKDISLRTPWMFKTLSGLNTINTTYVDHFDKEKIITIGCGPESLDSRIGTMMDLYKYACFDQINCKEIIPANLRKFEMSIMVYHMPLNNYHNKALTSQDNAVNDSLWGTLWNAVSPVPGNLRFDGRLEAKRTNDINNFSNMMSFKLFTFLNCEIDCENANEYYTDGMSNEQAFQLGNNQLKIKYDRVYEHRMNEWAQMFFGSDGIYYSRGVPEVFNAMEDDFKPKQTEINVNDQLVDRHAQRLNALNKQYIVNLGSGKLSIMDYQNLLVKRYYAPFNTSDHLDINYMGDPLSAAGNTYSQWFNKNKDSKTRWYNSQGGFGSIFRM